MSTHNNHKSDNLDSLLKRSLKTDEQPGAELNAILKAKLQEKEEVLVAAKTKRKVSLWYVPMLLNSFVLITLNLNLNIFIQNDIVLKIINSICIYLIITGIVLTFAGVKLSNLKESLTFELRKGGSQI